MQKLRGYIKGNRYTPFLVSATLPLYSLSTFNINLAGASGLITLDSPQNQIAFSKWISPKRTRSYPFARIYDTYHLNTKKITIIPIIKDEGQRGDIDRINHITFSWMSLLETYIVLGWYDTAQKHRSREGKITSQKFNSDYINEKIREISLYKSSALHWNTQHFERDFETIYHLAVTSYQRINVELNVNMHDPMFSLKVLERYKQDGKFSLDLFRDFSLISSQGAARRESLTIHAKEFLDDVSKNIIEITNYLGGTYYLSPDQILLEENYVVLQESKNTTRHRLPTLSDIKDGLFKLILYGNLDRLEIDGQSVQFKVRLKLTAALTGEILLPTSEEIIEHFCHENRLSKSQRRIIVALNQEAAQNQKLSVWITGNEIVDIQ